MTLSRHDAYMRRREARRAAEADADETHAHSVEESGDDSAIEDIADETAFPLDPGMRAEPEESLRARPAVGRAHS